MKYTDVELKEIHTALTLINNKRRIEETHGISREYEDPLKDLPLDELFSIGASGDLHKLSDKICPYLKSNCKKSRCMAFINGRCKMYQTSQNHPIVEKIEDGSMLSSSRAVIASQIVAAPPTASKEVKKYESK